MKLLGPCHEVQRARGARFIEYCGWQLPADYGSVDAELQSVRTNVGFTDYPFMSHVAVRGPDAFDVLQCAACRDLSRLKPGRAAYCLMLSESGDVQEDIILFRISDDFFLINGRLKVNVAAPNVEDVFSVKGGKDWLLSAAKNSNVYFYETGLNILSVQGPRSREMLSSVMDLDGLDYFGIRLTKIGDIPTLVARTGFSGEIGYEFFVWPECLVDIWMLLENVGAAYGISPFGIEVTQILGLEKGYLGGIDFCSGASPIELGLTRFVDMDKPVFPGRKIVIERHASGPRKRLVGLFAPERNVRLANGDAIMGTEGKIGSITTSRYSPWLRKLLARGWVHPPFPSTGDHLNVSTESGMIDVEVSEGYCWYDSSGKKPRS